MSGSSKAHRLENIEFLDPVSDKDGDRVVAEVGQIHCFASHKQSFDLNREYNHVSCQVLDWSTHALCQFTFQSNFWSSQ